MRTQLVLNKYDEHGTLIYSADAPELTDLQTQMLRSVFFTFGQDFKLGRPVDVDMLHMVKDCLAECIEDQPESMVKFDQGEYWIIVADPIEKAEPPVPTEFKALELQTLLESLIDLCIHATRHGLTLFVED